MINGNKVAINHLCVVVIVNDGNKKEKASERKEMRYLRVMLGLYKILAHYLIKQYTG